MFAQAINKTRATKVIRITSASENSLRTLDTPMPPGSMLSFCVQPSIGRGPSASKSFGQRSRKTGRADFIVLPGLRRTITLSQKLSACSSSLSLGQMRLTAWTGNVMSRG